MKNKIIALAGCLSLTACGIAAQYSAPQLISGDSQQVAFRSGQTQNPGPMADAYCSKFKRHAVLAKTEPADNAGNSFNFYFVCK